MNPKRSLVLTGTVRLLSFFYVCLALAAGGLTSSPPVWGQTGGQPTRADDPFKIERKNKAPVAAAKLPLRPIRFSEFKLENGLTVVIREDRRLPLVFAQLHIAGAGPIYEPPSRPGLANFTSQMLWAGTQTRSGYQITEEANKLGASLTSVTDFGSSVTTLNANGLSGNFKEWFALLTDVLLNPAFPPEAVSREQQRLRESLEARQIEPVMAARQFKRAVFGGHPAGVTSATQESVDRFTPATLADWHRERYAPQNAILGITGDVNTAELLNLFKKSFADWRKNNFTRALPTNPAPAAVKKIMLVDSDGPFNSAAVMAGDIAIERRSPDFFALAVMNHISGGAFSSRLYTNLRDSLFIIEGFGPAPALHAYSMFNAMEYRGDWFAYSLLRADTVEKALPTLLGELSRLRDEKVPEAELEGAKRMLALNFVLSMEDPATILNNEIIRRFYSHPEDYWDTYPSNIMAVTADDVQRVAKKYVNPGTFQIVAVGAAATVLGALQKLGPVEIYSIKNTLKGCAPASLAGPDDFSSTVAQFISFKNASATEPGSGKWNPAGCLPGAMECSISEESLTGCLMYRSAILEETEKFYTELVEKVAALIPENWKSRETGSASRRLKEFGIRLQGIGSPVSISLREYTLDEGEDPSTKYRVTLRFNAR